MKHNEKGSTLLLTVITIALLTVLGTATLAMTTMNVGMKYTDKTVKKTHYHSESGIEQAYAIVGDKLQQVMIEAKLETDDYIEKVQADIDQAIEIIQMLYLKIDGTIDEEIINTMVLGEGEGVNEIKSEHIGSYTTIVPVDMGGHKNALAYIYNTHLNSDLSIKGVVVQELIDDEYQSLFLSKWNSCLNEAGDNGLRGQLVNKENYIFNNETGMEMTAEGFNPMQEKPAGSQEVPTEEENKEINKKIEPTVIKVTSKYMEAGTERTISADIIVYAPNINHPIEIQDSVMIENPIWKYALVAGEDIKVEDTSSGKATGTNLEVQGNVYAYGTVPENSLALIEFGGLELGDHARVKITGDVVTQSFVQTKGSSAELVINRGNVFCNSLVVQKEVEPATESNSTIRLTDSYLYTKDDIELNGKGGTIDIEGKYIGFSDGSEAPKKSEELEEPKKNERHDNSSCIIINASDFGVGSMLRIKAKKIGEIQEGFTAVKQGGNTELDEIGILIPGTAWIGNNEYQTGESVSVKGNYFAYTQRFEDTLEPDGAFYDQSNVYSGTTISGMELVDGYKKSNGEKVPYTVSQKDKYFNKAYEKVYKDQLELYPDFNPGYRMETDESTGNNKVIEKGLMIEPQDYWYSLGSNMYRTGTSQGIATGKGGADTVRDIIGSVREDYEHILHKLLYRTQNDEISEACLTQKCVKAIEHYIDFKEEKTPQTIMYDSDITDASTEKQGILYYNPSTSQITITGGYLDGQVIKEGIIISAGDVVIEGNLEFDGTIIAGKSIIIRNNKLNDKASVNISNTRTIQKELGKEVNENILFQKPFKNSVTYQKTTQIIPGLGDTGIYQYNDLMKVTNWKQE